ncbi:MAG TPA: hypothetical protein VGF55_03495 [Gemmataceae bacterium]|jgi:hypothetical protein
MIGSQRHASWRVVAFAGVLWCLASGAARADEPAAPPRPDEPRPAAQPKAGDARPADESAGQQKPKEPAAKDSTNGGAAGSGQRFDPAVVSAGQAAFERSCTQCHDAARALDRTKDLAGWRATVQRMAAKRGADIPTSDFEPIATYLASRNAPAGGAAGGATAGAGAEAKAGAAAGADTSSLSTFATISPQWRGGSDHLQNSGFGPLAWVGASWQGKMVSGRVTACIACHGVGEPGLISRIEPAEAAVRVDLSEYLDKCLHGMKAGIDAGRFIVPFGAFSAQSDPSLYRTVSTPLIFNMGQRIFAADIGFPVLPMPYADEGVNLNTVIPLCKCHCGTDTVTLTTDTYLVNGLNGSSNDVDFFQSRDLLDNNNRAAGGARVTLGDQYVRAGASWTTGRYNLTTDPAGLYYRIFGFDVQAHYKRLLRFQAEWARREGDRIGFLPVVGTEKFTEAVSGYYVEAEARPWDKCHVSFLARYDQQTTSSPLPPPTSTLPTGHFNVERLTLGINIELWHQSLLMFDYERWLVPEPDHRHSDVFGVRYTITF